MPHVSLDLQSGATTTLLTQDGADIYGPGIESDGRYHLVQSLARDQGRLRLLDGEAGTGTLIAESAGNAMGVLSPDGC